MSEITSAIDIIPITGHKSCEYLLNNLVVASQVDTIVTQSALLEVILPECLSEHLKIQLGNVLKHNINIKS